MSEPHDHAQPGHDAAESHEGPIKNPRQLIAAVVAAFVVPIVVIVLLANFVDFGARTGAGSGAEQEEAVARRIQPVGSVDIRLAGAATALRSGEEVYQAQCAACHATGLVGSPKFGDAAAWGPRIKTGFEALLNSALKGKGAMTPQGGGSFNDTEIGRGVVYLANHGGAKFDEPKAPAAAASAGATASAPN
jgi:cytochrome c5